jgi:hypothetical protein
VLLAHGFRLAHGGVSFAFRGSHDSEQKQGRVRFEVDRGSAQQQQHTHCTRLWLLLVQQQQALET